MTSGLAQNRFNSLCNHYYWSAMRKNVTRTLEELSDSESLPATALSKTQNHAANSDEDFLTVPSTAEVLGELADFIGDVRNFNFKNDVRRTQKTDSSNFETISGLDNVLPSNVSSSQVKLHLGDAKVTIINKNVVALKTQANFSPVTVTRLLEAV